jgi:hypothetical protein
MHHSPTGSESFGNDSLDLWLICIQVIIVWLSFYLYNIFCYCRYPDDVYDRYWFPVQGSNSTFVKSTNFSGVQSLMTNKSVLPMTDNGEHFPPDAVMRTALTDTNGNMTILFPDLNTYEAFVSFYYAELDPTANNNSRNYYVAPYSPYGSSPYLVNPILNESNTGYNLPNALTYGIFEYSERWNILLYPDDPPSPLGPLVNALEFLEYESILMAPLTNLQDGELIIWV